jgi:hypothetical protein
MRLLIPFTNQLFNLGLQLVFRCKVGALQPFTMQNVEPWFDLIHPRAMSGREVHDNVRVLGELLEGLLPMMGADIVAHEVNHCDVLINLAVQLFQKGRPTFRTFLVGARHMRHH